MSLDLELIRNNICAKVGGLDTSVATLVKKFANYITSSVESELPIARSAGVILSGIPGSGKTKLAVAFAQATGLSYRISADAQDSGKRVLILEEIDVLAGSKRANTLEARMSSLLLDCMDQSLAFVVGTTSLLNTLPEEIRRPGRLDTTIDLHLVDAKSRAAVLKIMLCRFNNIAQADDDILRIAKKAHGFSPADLQNLCTRAFMEHRGDTTVTDLEQMVKSIVPSNLNSFQSKVPRVLFSDIYGLDETIDRVKSLVFEPLCEPEKFQAMQVEPPRGALIYGPPGSGKSLLCCAIANELAVNTIWVDASQVRSMIVGESEKAIADLFAQARKSSPCILLFDHQRGAILKGIMARMPAAVGVRGSEECISELVELTRGYSGADLANVCREAALCALRRDINSETVAMDDFRQGLTSSRKI
ncbi:hypothetical protein IW145_001844 [Coemansia sp. RSA 521]|nr:hypothetical protein IW145_001844 [Coemansia sp. RSA 521]